MPIDAAAVRRAAEAAARAFPDRPPSPVLQAPQPDSTAAFVQSKMSQVALAGNNHGNSSDHGGRDAQDVRVQIVRVKNLKTAAPQKSRQPKHLVHAVRRIETTLRIELADLHRTSRQPLKQRPAGAQATQRHIVAIGVEPGGEFDGLDFGSANVQGIEEIKYFPAVRCFRMRAAPPGRESH